MEKKFIGDRLLQARKARGITAVTLSELVGITGAAISRFEHSKDTPKSDTLQLIADKLNMPVGFFFKPIPNSDPEQCLKWRSFSGVAKYSRERGSSKYDWLKDDFVDYFEHFFDMPSVNFPNGLMTKKWYELSDKDIDEIAFRCREHWGLGEEPIHNAVLLLENNGVIISRIALGDDKQDAFSDWTKSGRPYMILGSEKNNFFRARTDTCHELGHFILHKDVSESEYKTPEKHKAIEKQAFRFASAFLMPRRAFFGDLWAPTLDAFAAIKPKWKTSVKAMIVHSFKHGVINDEQYSRMMINYNRRWKNGEPMDDEFACEKPRLLSRCVESLVDSGIKSKQQIIADMCFFGQDIEELAGLPRGFLQDSKAEIIQIEPKFKETQSTVRSINRSNLFHLPKRPTNSTF
jgi:Zn-dependent peptidase ImmA (M78 family)/transcriptional regulator with XRE-family HTH domain